MHLSLFYVLPIANAILHAEELLLNLTVHQKLFVALGGVFIRCAGQ